MAASSEGNTRLILIPMVILIGIITSCWGGFAGSKALKDEYDDEAKIVKKADLFDKTKAVLGIVSLIITFVCSMAHLTRFVGSESALSYHKNDFVVITQQDLKLFEDPSETFSTYTEVPGKQ